MSTMPEPMRAPTGSTGQPASVLSAWIEEQLRELQDSVLQRLAQAREKLQSGAFEWDNAQLARSIEVWRDESERLHFEPLLRRSVVDLLLGRGMDARNNMVQQHAKVLAAANAARQQFEEMSRAYRTQAGGVRRLLVEMDFERTELDRCIAQAVEWLAEMTADVNQSGASGAMTGEQAASLMRRGEFYAGHIKRLHGISAQVNAIMVQGQNVLERRNALLAQMKVDLEGYERVWLRNTGPLVSEARSRGGLKGVENAAMAHSELVKRLGRTHDLAQALQQEEHNMGHRLHELRASLDQLRR